jgi:hypothetical protein
MFHAILVGVAPFLNGADALRLFATHAFFARTLREYDADIRNVQCATRDAPKRMARYMRDASANEIHRAQHIADIIVHKATKEGCAALVFANEDEGAIIGENRIQYSLCDHMLNGAARGDHADLYDYITALSLRISCESSINFFSAIYEASRGNHFEMCMHICDCAKRIQRAKHIAHAVHLARGNTDGLPRFCDTTFGRPFTVEALCTEGRELPNEEVLHFGDVVIAGLAAKQMMNGAARGGHRALYEKATAMLAQHAIDHDIARRAAKHGGADSGLVLYWRAVHVHIRHTRSTMTSDDGVALSSAVLGASKVQCVVDAPKAQRRMRKLREHNELIDLTLRDCACGALFAISIAARRGRRDLCDRLHAQMCATTLATGTNFDYRDMLFSTRDPVLCELAIRWNLEQGLQVPLPALWAAGKIARDEALCALAVRYGYDDGANV